MSSINVIGAACVDLLITGVDQERFFSGKHKVSKIETSFGGDALNEAFVLNALHDDVSLKTVLGKDAYGDLILNELNKRNIGYEKDILKENIDTYLSLVLIDRDGQRSFVGPENGSSRLLDIDDIRIDEDCKIVSFASLFISKMMDSDKYETLFSMIKEKEIVLCVDTSTPKNNENAKDLSYLKYIDYFFCNESEAYALCDCDDPYVCEKILCDSGIRHVIIKLGEKGCLCQGKIYPPERNIRCIDSTGAGDSFVSGFIHFLNNGKGIEECIAFANRCGTKACEYIGATTWLEDISEII